MDIRAADVSFEQLKLSKGNHMIAFQVLGKNERSRGFLFGVDYLKLGQSTKE